MARTNGSGFKMKRSPAKKGMLEDIFSSLGRKKTEERQKKQRESNTGEYAGMTNFEKRRAEKKSRKPGESKFQADVRKRKARNKAKRNMVDKNKDKISDFIQPHSITNPAPKGQETVSSKPKSKGNHFTFSGKKGDKFKYRVGPWKDDYSHSQFQRPGSDVWETSKTKEGARAIHDLYMEDYEGRNVEITPIQKKSPSKKRGFRMKRKK